MTERKRIPESLDSEPKMYGEVLTYMATEDPELFLHFVKEHHEALPQGDEIRKMFCPGFLEKLKEICQPPEAVNVILRLYAIYRMELVDQHERYLERQAK